MKKFISKKYQGMPDNSFSFADNIYDDLINFSVGDPDQNTHDIIIDKAFQDAKDGYTHYTNSSGMIELRQEISKYQKEEYGLDFSTDEIFVTTSGCHAIFLILNALLDEGDEIIIPTPHFSLYDFEINNQKAKPVFLETLEEEDFQINPERLESLITPKTKALMINTPNNPTGTCLTLDTLKSIAQIAIKHDILVIADDIYTLFSYQNPFFPICKLDGMQERTITIRAFSKDFLMTGWRIGYVLADKEFIRIIKSINDNIIYSPPSISQRGALHALKHRHEIQPAIKKEFQERLNLAYDRITKIPKLKVLPVKGTFYLFVNIRGTGMTSDEFCEQLLKNCHVLAISGNAFGKGEGFIRLAVTLTKEKINEAFDRIEKWLN